MAAVVGDYVSDPSRFHNMIATSGIQHQHSHDTSHYRSSNRSTDIPARRQSASPRYRRPSTTTSTRQQSSAVETERAQHVATGVASRFPSPPSSSSPRASSGPAHAENASSPAYMTTESRTATQAVGHAAGGAAPLPATQQQPSPPSESLPRSSANPLYRTAGTMSPPPPQSQTIHIRDLAHIQSLTRADMLTGNGSGILNDPPLQQMKYEISAMPINDIIEMVAALLTKITTTNDLQHDALQRNAAHQQQASQNNESGSGNQMSPLSTSVLAFHGKNVPAITILSYLSRIHKYCPTTYEVFLSLLVYFDRMTERVNDLVMKNEEAKRLAAENPTPAAPPPPAPDVEDSQMKEETEDSDETDSDLADDDDSEDDEMEDRQPRTPRRRSSSSAAATAAAREGGGKIITGESAPSVASGPATYFVVDSFNIHRLIIAGVTCASKFFSDVFYTNSRYAKVGGLPLPELNHLELQFLLLNDFRLAVPVEDLEAYATMLVEFYAREVVAQRSRSVGGSE